MDETQRPSCLPGQREEGLTQLLLRRLSKQEDCKPRARLGNSAGCKESLFQKLKNKTI